MAGLDSVNTTAEVSDNPYVDTAAETPTPGLTSGMVGKGAKATVANEGVLANMQRLLEEKTAQRNGFMEAMKDAAAWASTDVGGPSRALAERARTREEEDKNLFGLQAQIAAQKLKMDQLKAFNAANAATKANMGVGGGGAGGWNAENQAQYDLLAGTEGVEAANKFKNSVLLENTKSRLNPAWGAIVKFPYNGQLVDMTLEQAVQLAKVNPNLPQSQAVLRQAGELPSSSTQTKAAEGPFRVVRGEGDGHKGVDIATPVNTPVTASVEGTVRHVTSDKKGYGNGLEIVDANGKRVGIIGHLNGYNVPDGTKVKAGDVVGFTGGEKGTPGAGNSTGPHAHIEGTGLAVGKPGQQNVSPTPVSSAKPETGGYVAALPANATSSQIQQAMELDKKRAEVGMDVKAEGLKGLEKAGLETSKDINDKWLSAGPRMDTYDRVTNLAQNNKSMLGILVKPGVMPSAGQVLKDGLKIGQHGQIAMPVIEQVAAQMSKDATTQKLANREELKGYLHQIELDASKLIKGQGSVSDAERRILSGIAGSVSDPASLILKKVALLKAHAEYDQRMGDAYRSFMSTNKGSTPQDFINSNAYGDVVKSHIDGLRKNFNKEFSVGKDIKPEGDSSKDDARTARLNKYAPQ